MRALAAAITLALTATTQVVEACQDPPSAECEIVAAATVVPQGVPFEVYFTITNLDPRPPQPPAVAPQLDDLEFTLSASAAESQQSPTGGECFNQGGTPHAIDPTEVVFTLDDSLSPAADQPNTWTGMFTVTPSGPSLGSYVEVVATSEDRDADGRPDRQCVTSVCVETSPDLAARGIPDAFFEIPSQLGDAGSVLPFDLRVRRNGYDPSRPLTVKVEPQNFSDAVDIFPLDPPDLPTAGVEVLGDDELVHFTCSLHYPCFPGAANVYHVSIWDGPAELWNSRWINWLGLGEARVVRGPLARAQLVEALAEDGLGSLRGCSPGTVHLRLFARNPFAGADLEAARLELDLPSGVTVLSHELHFHDNPMDAIDPPPQDLAADGVVTIQPGLFAVDVARIEPRFASEIPPVTVFRDLFEVELVLHVDGIDDASELTFPGLRVSGTAAGELKQETGAQVTIPLEPGDPPAEVSPAGAAVPLRFAGTDRRLEWEGLAPSGARTFNVHRGAVRDVWRRDYGECVASGLSASSFVDLEAPPPGGWFYLVRGWRCAALGTAGRASTGDERAILGPCP